MVDVIHLKEENVKIIISKSDDMFKEQGISLEGAIVRCIKHVYRYGEFTMPKNIMISILWAAHKGTGCKEDHFSAPLRISLYDYLKDKDIEDVYIKQFMEETKERLRC